jgi:hypothetical protein
MSWAARRKTTRIEDKAYCLLGLFGIHMPILYGEGTSTFHRLQLELIKTSHDQTIFAWSSGEHSFSRTGPRTGLLASSPDEFAKSNNIVEYYKPNTSLEPFSMTNLGIPLVKFFNKSSRSSQSSKSID